MADIDWESINAKLPFQRTDEEKAKRRELFKQFDPNSNGYLSLAEVRKTKFILCPSFEILFTGKSLSEALLFAEHGENMLCTKIVLNIRSNFCTQHVLPRFSLGIFMYSTCNSMNKELYLFVQ